MKMREFFESRIKNMPNFPLGYLLSLRELGAKVGKGIDIMDGPARHPDQWEVHTCSNGAWFVAPSDMDGLPVECENIAAHWSGELTPFQFFLVVNLYTCSHLSFLLHDKGKIGMSEYVGGNYYLLKDWVFNGSGLTEQEATDVYWAID